MDEATFQERAARLEHIAEVLNKLPPEVRSAAFALLQDWVVGAATGTPDAAAREQGPPSSPAAAAVEDDRERFFTGFPQDKPSDNVKLIAAWLYSRYGAEPFSLDEIREIATDVGLTIPGRVDMTVSAAKQEGKSLFTSAGRAKFKPTVHGEAYLKNTYSVTKGTGKRPVTAE